ncbi:hypothetical protein ABZ318_28720 [Streptomyces sp. NPDC006197]|uniref:hypothetical protein n=1 Tax=Streptomyces sp. NPDC006197 TaxID=3156685 RepID=UPI0033B1AE0B
MSVEEPSAWLPSEFLRAIASQSAAGSPPARMAVERVRGLPDSGARNGLVLALLGGAYRDAAPEWLLQVAIDSGLREEGAHLYAGSPMQLAFTALSHPSCTQAQREQALGRCSTAQLGVLGHEGCGEVMAAAVVAELRRRGPHGRPMSVEGLEKPSAAQVVLRDPQLHSSVFFAALELLPAFPELSGGTASESNDVLADHEAFMAACEAWESMWAGVVSVHTGRHRELLEWSEGSRANRAIRECMLGSIPWDVEASLLEEVALEHLAGFEKRVLITRACRMLRDGLSKQQVCERLSKELEALSAADLRQFNRLTSEDFALHDVALHGAVFWVQSAAESTWRHLLSPSEARPRFGNPYTWRASEELLATLGRRFAQQAMEALRLWEPGSQTTRPSPQDLRWLHSLLVHLPDITPEVKQKARAVLQHTRPQHRSRWETASFVADQRERELAGLRAAVEGILGDPTAVTRSTALGDPEQITVQRLARMSDDVLIDYLSRHAGNDELVEKTLLAFAGRSSYGAKIHFADVLTRHSAPDAALLQITTGLRKRLGGGPQLREGWARQVLRLPDCPADVICALPAWTALTVGGPEHGTAHPVVVALVIDALGDDEEAWARFADSPASYAGPTAWLRLGDILTAAADGTPWPKPPAGR